MNAIDPKRLFALLGASDVQPALRTGALLADRYEMRQKVGAGAMGEVWRAYDPVLGREVAVKMTLGTSEAELARFEREAELTARVNHPGIVGIHACGWLDDRPFLVCELIPGAKRFNVMVPGWTLSQRLRALTKAAEALAALHEAGVIHRDVKPDNVLVDTAGRVRVVDLGIAVDPETSLRLTMTGAVVGTPAYMAPEQLSADRARIGPATDVWALGVMLYECLFEVSPFRATSLQEVAEKVKGAPPPIPANTPVSDALSALCTQALDPDPRCRPRNAGAFAAALASAQPRSAAPSNRAWLLVPGALILLAALLVALVDPEPSVVTETPAPIDAPVDSSPVVEHIQPAPGPAEDVREFRVLQASAVALWENRLGALGSDGLSVFDLDDPDRGFVRAGAFVDMDPDGLGGLLVLDRQTVWRLAAGRTELVEVVRFSNASFLAAAPDGRFALVKRNLRQIVIFSPAGVELDRFDPEVDGVGTGLAWVGDDLALHGRLADDGVTVREVPGGRVRWLEAGYFASLGSSADGQRMVLGYGGGAAKVVDAATGELVFSLSNKRPQVLALDDPLASLFEGAHMGSVRGLVFSPDGAYIVSASASMDDNYPPEVTLWNATTGDHLGTSVEYGRTYALAMSPDGERVAVANGARDRVMLVPLETLRERP
ncbi:serine/threonine-protein kinase [Planctomycetota bacterium]|nr:serine/threonine-protein kinase [Planctomycetota bacterium]